MACAVFTTRRCTINKLTVGIGCFSVANPDLELRGGGGGGLELLALLAFFPSVMSSFLPKISGSPGPPGPSPRSDTAFFSNLLRASVAWRGGVGYSHQVYALVAALGY